MEIVKTFVVVIGIITIQKTHGLTIDNQLVIIANDCYTRIAIGSTLPSKDISSSVTAVTVTECEDECSRKRSTCEVFSFGISSKGNASCLLGTSVPIAEDLVPHPDFDIYIRQQSSPHCMPDRLYKLGSGQRNPISNVKGNDAEREEHEDGEKGGSKPKPGKRPIVTQSIIPGPGGFGTVLINQPNSEVPVSSEKRPSGSSHKNRPNFPGYQVTEDSLNYPPEGYGHHGGPSFDPDNPNRPYEYGNKNYYGSQGNSNFQHFYHVEHEDIPDANVNPHDYYYNDGPGNRYGTNYHETPLTVCKNQLSNNWV